MAIRSKSAYNAPEQNKTFTATASRTGDTPAYSRIVQNLLAVGVMGMAVVSTGCSMTSGICRSIGNNHCIDDFMIGHRNKTLAQKAWICNKDHFCNKKYASEFKDGFMQGYSDVASGGNGCIPAVAPSQYWGWRYQSAQGQQAINAYFEGYPLGVQAAEEDGIAHWQTISPIRGLPPGVAASALTPAVIQDHSQVANPFYSMEEAVPAPVVDHSTDDPPPPPSVIDDIDVEDSDDVKEMDDDAETVFNRFPDEMSIATGMSDEPELISQLNIAQSQKAATVEMDAETGSTEITDVVIDEIFGSTGASQTISDEELPFSFE